MKKRIIALLTCIMISSLYTTAIYAVDSNNISNMYSKEYNMSTTFNNKYNKLHFYLDKADFFTIDSENEMIEAFDYIETSEFSQMRYNNANYKESLINVTIQFASDFSETKTYRELLDRRKELDTMDDVHAWREDLNSYSEMYHSELVEKSITHIENLDYEINESIKYSPFVLLKMDVENIYMDDFSELINNSNIMHISFAYESELAGEMSWNETLDTVNAYNIATNRTYTGQGVKIGIKESGGICDINHKSLENINITMRENTTVHSHATAVTAILYNIAPDAEYYLEHSNNPSTGLSWFIDNGCDIVNYSAGLTGAKKNQNGVYEHTGNEYRMDIDGLYDYQIQQHFITVVKSAGNVNTDNTSGSYNPEGYITNPGYAYNIITVGGVSTNSSNELIHYSGSAYVTVPTQAKPNVSAPAVVNIPGIGVTTGTSVSAPLVAANIALFCEKNPRLASYTELILSLVTTSAYKTNDYSHDTEFFDRAVGAGVIDLEKMLSIIDDDFYDTNKNESGEIGTTEIIFFRKLSLNKGDMLQASISWIVRCSATEIYFSDYDLELYDPDGILIAESVFADQSNIEMIRYTIPKNGEYILCSTLYSSFVSGGTYDTDWLAFTYSID